MQRPDCSWQLWHGGQVRVTHWQLPGASSVSHGPHVFVWQVPVDGSQDSHGPLHWTGLQAQVVASRVWHGGQASFGHSGGGVTQAPLSQTCPRVH